MMDNNGIIYGNPKNDLERYVLGTTHFARTHSNLWYDLMTSILRKPDVVSRRRLILIRKHTGNTFRENAASLTLEPSEVMFWNCLGYNAYDTTIKVYTHPISLWQQLYRNRPTKNKSFVKR